MSSCARPANEPSERVSTCDAERQRGAAARDTGDGLGAAAPLLLQEYLVRGAEESQLQLSAFEFEFECGERGKWFAAESPGQVVRACVGVGGVQGREHGSAPLTRKRR
jgi:hypothetical protein